MRIGVIRSTTRQRMLVAAMLVIGLPQPLFAMDKPFGITVIDRQTERGIPLVELVTTHDVVFVTDSAGRAAINVPQWNGQEMYFHVRSPGYRMAPDGFGYSGARLRLTAGGAAILKMERTNPAERLYRITGQDRYLDSRQLQHEIPENAETVGNTVAGQDSVQVTAYRGRLYWFWGDTSRLSYPLGLFRTAGATSPLPRPSAPGADKGVLLEYFTGDDGFARAMADIPDPVGVVWIDGLCTVSNAAGQERMVAHFSRRRGLAEQLEHGLLIYNDERQIFEVLQVLEHSDTWRFVRDHPVRVTQDGIDYLMFGNPFPITRVPATMEAIQDRGQYESWTCQEDMTDTTLQTKELGRGPRSDTGTILRNAGGQPDWGWRRQPPTTQQTEYQWLTQEKLSPDEARFVPVSKDPQRESAAERPVLLHSGTVFWNEWRNRWIMTAVSSATDRDSPSYLGEVWYSEAPTPQGPFRIAVRIATHPGQSFYNPCHHPFFDEDGGQRIYFEGTYCNTFTKSPPTPRYNYNQLMYRLDLNSVAHLFADSPTGKAVKPDNLE